MSDAVQLLLGDARSVLASLPAQSVHTCITSPPYFGLRSYQCGAQEIGTEQTPPEYVSALVAVFRAVRRVLRDDGTLWVVLGDSYSTPKVGSTKGSGGSGLHSNVKDPLVRARGNARLASTRAAMVFCKQRPAGIPAKSLLGLPWRVAFALQDDGWLLRQELIWHKPNPMPESVKDRCTRAHETVFMLVKGPSYFYDQDATRETAVKGSDHAGARNYRPWATANQRLSLGQTEQGASAGRNRRSVWSVATVPFSAHSLGITDVDHYAAFPPELVRPMVRAATSERGCCPHCGAPWQRVVERTSAGQRHVCPKDAGYWQTWGHSTGPRSGLHSQYLDTHVHTSGWQATCSCDAGQPVPATVLDCFAGSGTTGLVAVQEGRRFMGIDLNQDYCTLARARIASVQPPLPRLHATG